MGSGASSSSKNGSYTTTINNVGNNSTGSTGSTGSSGILDKRLIDHDKNDANDNNNNNNDNDNDNNDNDNDNSNDNDIYDETRLTRYKDDEHDDDDDGDGENDEMFENAALSLEMENDELLFNLLYFSQQSEQQCNNSNQFRNMLNNAFEETVALHSENNTPYKLRPASKDTINSIKSSKYTNDENEKECIVCRDEMELGCEIIKLPCHHCFHSPCIVRWLSIQSFCPICKGQITSLHDEKRNNFNEEKAEDTNNITYQDDDNGI